jgi:hypothetical protein
VFLLCERAFKRASGKKVGGIWGRIWVYLELLVFAQGLGEHIRTVLRVSTDLIVTLVDAYIHKGIGATRMLKPISMRFITSIVSGFVDKYQYQY